MEKQISTLKSLVRAAFYTTAGVAIGTMSSVNAAGNYGLEKGNFGTGSAETADNAIKGLITNVLTFLGLLAVVYLLWGGFNILTAAGDDEKVKKGKTVITQAAIGIVVIFLAYSIVSWIFSLLV